MNDVNIIKNIGNIDDWQTLKPALPKQEMGKDEFLKLLITQMQQQDPTNPMDNAQMIAQTAQFSSLEQMSNMAKSMDKLVDMQNQLLTFGAASYVGMETKAAGDALVVFGGNTEPIEFNLAADAKEVKVSIYNDKSELVRIIDPGGLDKGSQTLYWEAINSGGDPLKDGNYRFQVSATDQLGEAVGVDTFTVGRIMAIRYDADGVKFVVNGKDFQMKDLQSIFPPSAPYVPDDEDAEAENTEQPETSTT
ncbi:flagellar hook assembly protein FlgD [Chrysiogenes arsenatis]|uniref:flagellar hook assembly protein FlgD n=1 Tax=Chrysiogenes arsenatis TaxID=309797 RepID=UPI0003F87A1C|nr:flagellar hook capping FlgD N-terminal domain-containing protein [Chrysiogenes arsenatis]